jgi:hypothetical protein
MNRAGQIDLVVNTNSSNKAPVSIAQCSDQTLTLATSVASSLLKYGESGLPRVDIPKLRPAKILDKRFGNDGCVVDERTDPRPRPFVFSKDDDRPLNDGQPPTKRATSSFLRLLVDASWESPDASCHKSCPTTSGLAQI